MEQTKENYSEKLSLFMERCDAKLIDLEKQKQQAKQNVSNSQHLQDFLESPLFFIALWEVWNYLTKFVFDPPYTAILYLVLFFVKSITNCFALKHKMSYQRSLLVIVRDIRKECEALKKKEKEEGDEERLKEMEVYLESIEM